MTIQVEVSLYPLKTVDPAPIIDTFCRVLKQDGHEMETKKIKPGYWEITIKKK